jgi:ribosomal protein S18 acetylase RimI-like enzyme
MRVEAPIAAALAGELRGFWDDIFEYSAEHPPDVPPDAYLGSETDHNRLSVYLERRADTLAGTCAITVPKEQPVLGGFGEVATRPELRGSGIATRLCGRAVEEFRAASGQALFLGTSSPPVRRIYHRLGWRKLAGADVMANISSRDTPEAFLVDHFRKPGEAAVVAATPAVRVPMIPLLHAPHDWQVLDANAGMYSTRYCVQYSCMGLYRRYLAAVSGGAGDWFCARTADGRVVGLATVCGSGAACRVDGFTHPYFAAAWPDLMAAAVQRAAERGAGKCHAAVCVEDEEKRSLFEGLGFRDAGPAADFELDGRAVGAVRMVTA